MEASGMQGFITALQTNLTTTNLWGEITAMAGFLGLMVVFAFGYRLVRRLISKVSKGKAGI